MDKLIHTMRAVGRGTYFSVAKSMVKDWLFEQDYGKVVDMQADIEGIDMLALKPNEVLGITVIPAGPDTKKALPVWKSLIAKAPDRLHTFKATLREINDRRQADIDYLKKTYNLNLKALTIVSVTDPVAGKNTLYSAEGFHPTPYVKELKFVKSTALHSPLKYDRIVSSPEDIEDAVQLLLVRDSRTLRKTLDTLFGVPR